MIILKIFLSFVFWFIWGFLCILGMAFAVGGPKTTDGIAKNISQIQLIGTAVSLLPILIYITYRLVRYFWLQNSNVLFSTQDIFLIFIPSILVAIIVYFSS